MLLSKLISALKFSENIVPFTIIHTKAHTCSHTKNPLFPILVNSLKPVYRISLIVTKNIKYWHQNIDMFNCIISLPENLKCLFI